jgi:site-specific DNA recombinase
MAEAYAKVINNAYRIRTKTQRDDVQLISEQINTANKDITKARTLLLKEEIDARDFREIKQENEKRVTVLEARLIEISAASTNIGPQLLKAVNVLSHLDVLYNDGDVKKKRAIISSIYPEKIVFDGFEYRTTRLNEVVELVYKLDEGLGEIKNRNEGVLSPNSGEVVPTGIEPVSKV